MNVADATALLEQHQLTERTHSGAGLRWVFRILVVTGVAAAWFAGGPLVRACAVGAGLFAMLGELDGAWRHVARIGWFSFIIYLLVQFASDIAVQIRGPLQLGAGSSLVVTCVGVMVIAWILFMIAMRLTRGFISARPRLQTANHIFGGFVGAAEGALVVIVGLWTFDAFGGTMDALLAANRGREGSFAAMWVNTVHESVEALRGDQTYATVARLNPIEENKTVQQTAAAIETLSSVENLEAFGRDERVQAFVSDPMVKEKLQIFQNDESLRTALQQRDMAALLTNPKLRGMLSDGAFQEKLVGAMPSLWSAFTESKNAGAGSNGQKSSGQRRRTIPTPSKVTVEDLGNTPLSPERERIAKRQLREIMESDK